MNAQDTERRPHPTREAFAAFQATKKYQNIRAFALSEKSVDEALWAAFAKGWGESSTAMAVSLDAKAKAS